MNAIEIAMELVMEATILYVAYMFWQGWRRTGDQGMLLLTWTFGIIFVAHTIFAVVIEDLLGYSVPKPLEAHHLLFLGLLFVIIYIQRQRQWRAELRTTPKTEGKEKAA